MAQPAPPARPVVVTAAAVVMLAIALAGLATTVGLLSAAAGFAHRYQPLAQATQARPKDIESVQTAVRWGLGTLAVVILLLAVVITVLAVGVLRGGNPARIGTWVLVGVGLLCGCLQCFGALSAVNTMRYSGDTERLDVASQLTRAVQHALPGWLGGLVGTAAGGQVLGYILVAVLLGLPPANAWFRRSSVAQPVPVPGGTPWPPPNPYPPTLYPPTSYPPNRYPPSPPQPPSPSAPPTAGSP